jgi:hypothetical protein
MRQYVCAQRKREQTDESLLLDSERLRRTERHRSLGKQPLSLLSLLSQYPLIAVADGLHGGVRESHGLGLRAIMRTARPVVCRQRGHAKVRVTTLYIQTV